MTKTISYLMLWQEPQPRISSPKEHPTLCSVVMLLLNHQLGQPHTTLLNLTI